ncbi:MAG: hypothetical protein M0Q24_11410 [Sulfurimonas sp.]|jgi:hypothetical protein|uniref:hypothetical protein n=1 Tax=Sulfurimonas sp. TaxID=2022749 RepID=UPI0025EA3F8C|nr:hypothetical protein [Sulfurimonas sp.]MCK9492680.1 hypothetical protein [Sulfurimonas sp.]
MDNELNTKFTDQRGRERDVRITVAIAHAFCREHRAKLEHFVPCLMDSAQLLDLAYAGTRRGSWVTAHGETKDEFFEALEGPALARSQEAAANAVVNFTLRCGTEMQRRMLQAEVALRGDGVAEAEIVERLTALAGPGGMSAASVDVPEPEAPGNAT